MAKIQLKVSYSYTGNQQYEQYTDYFYDVTVWEFDTVTRSVTNTTNDITLPDSALAEDYSRPTTESFFWECLNGTSTRRDYYHDGDGSFTVQDTANSSSCTTGGGVPADGTFLRNDCNGLDLQQVLADGAGGEKWGVVVETNAVSCGYIANPVYGCIDYEASNFDPKANTDNGTCTYPAPLAVTLPAPIAVVGNPMEIVLQSTARGAGVSRKASAVLTVGAMVAGDRVTVNGITFTYAPIPAAGQFSDVSTLAQALEDEELLGMLYLITQPTANQVKLEAKQGGTRYTPEITHSGNFALALTAGVDALRSEALAEWGCYVEVWACQGKLGTEVSKSAATLAGRLERLRLPENSYRFDVSQLMARELGHSLFSENDRLQPYFLRYGEIYTPHGQTRRRRKPMADTPILWAMEGALPLQQVNQITASRLLSTLPAKLTLPLHGFQHCEALYVLAQTGTLEVRGTFTAYDGTTPAAESLESRTIGANSTFDYTFDYTFGGGTVGGVMRLPLDRLFTRALALGATKKVIAATMEVRADGQSLGSYKVNFQKLTEPMRCLVFVSSLGAYEFFWMEGIPENSLKRNADTFARTLPPVRTSSSRQQVVRSVELNPATVLHSGLLDQATYRWLCAELAASPDVFLFDPLTGAYTAANITDFDTKADEVEEEYYLTLTLEQGLPHNPLRN
ncbi:hypothetical protein [Rufibacter soli]